MAANTAEVEVNYQLFLRLSGQAPFTNSRNNNTATIQDEPADQDASGCKLNLG